MTEKNTILGVDSRHVTPIKFDAFSADKLTLAGGKYRSEGKVFSSSDFKDDEEYESLSEYIKDRTN